MLVSRRSLKTPSPSVTTRMSASATPASDGNSISLRRKAHRSRNARRATTGAASDFALVSTSALDVDDMETAPEWGGSRDVADRVRVRTDERDHVGVARLLGRGHGASGEDHRLPVALDGR